MKTKVGNAGNSGNAGTSGVRRALVLSLDALVAFLVFSSAIAALYLFEQSFWAPELIQTSLQSTAQEATDALSRLRIVDVRREPTVAALFDSGDLSDDDLNRTLIEVIGSFWAVNNTGNASIAANLTRALFAAYIPENANWALVYADDAVYNSSDLPSSGFVASSRKLVSGIAKGAPPTGCVASAYLQRIASKSEAAYYYFGGFVGQGNLTVVLRGIPSDANVSSVFLELSAGDNFTVYANNANCGSFNVSSGNYSVANWSVTAPACLAALTPGADNNFTIDFNGSQIANQFIGGGFIKVSYNTTSFATQPSSSTRQYFPGINGLFNYYDTFYVPGAVASVSGRLHFYNNFTTNFTIGNKTVFNSSGSDVDQLVLINNASFSALFNYSADLNEKNVPMKLWAYANVTGGGGYADVILITDKSGSMDERMNSTSNGYDRVCTDTRLYDNDTARIALARCVDKQFVEAILGGQGNRVGLVAFSTSANDYYPLSTNVAALEANITNYDASGSTCLCCAINRAYQLLNTTYITQLVPSRSLWSYNASYPTTTPPNDYNGSAWSNRSYNVSWQNASAILGFGSGVTTNIGSNLVTLESVSLNAAQFKNISGTAEGSVTDTQSEDGVTLNLSAPANATWIGQFDQAGNSASDAGYDRFTNVSTNASARNYSVPAGYTTLTTFGYYFGSGNGCRIYFKVFRLVSGSTYRVIYESNRQNIVAGSQQQFALSPALSVQAGDYVGFRAESHGGCSTANDKISRSGDNSNYRNGDLNEGQQGAFTSLPNYYYTVGALVTNGLALSPIEARFNSSSLSSSFNVTSISAFIKFNSTTADAYSMLIFNYNTSSWESSGCSSATVTANAWTTFYCNATGNASYYLSPTRNVTIALNKTSGGSATTLKIDSVQFNAVRAQGDYFFRKMFYIANISLLLNANLTVYSDDAAEVYLNGVLVDSDSGDHNAAYWNRFVPFNTSANLSLFKQGWNSIAVRLKNNDNASAKFDAEINASWHRDRYMIVMSDGVPNIRCLSDCSTATCNGNSSTSSCSQETDSCSLSTSCPSRNANYSSCRAHSELNVTVNSVGFGPVAACNFANSTLQAVAQCGNGSYFASDNASQLADFYRSLANSIVTQSTTQQAFVTGEVNSILYSDSWLDFSFTPDTPNYGYQEMSVDLETPKFTSCQGSFAIPTNMRVDSFKASSYSGEYWTDNATLLNTGTGGWKPFFNLSVYGQIYRYLGDPFVLQANASVLRSGETNRISIRTGNSTSTPNPNCTSWNQGFYTARVHAAVNYSNVFLYCKARNATVYYDLNYDGVADGNVNVSMGSNLPSAGAAFVPPENFSADNAVDDAFQRLLNNLDFVPGGAGPSGSQTNPVGIKLSDSVSSQILTGQGIPFAWGPSEASIIVWGK